MSNFGLNLSLITLYLHVTLLLNMLMWLHCFLQFLIMNRSYSLLLQRTNFPLGIIKVSSDLIFSDLIRSHITTTP